ncbi:Stp1/IreP family PP2C-type Ser/Thr phosphatase [Methyloversatilis sp.]|uniref:Stp1/IreP family PP2C-type Ser/Thr phosphatase n=1 Tax=Methyloversatilis sp. TaxID=2569862 RepID=UPI0035B44CBF
MVSRSDSGMVRTHNEDAVAMQPAIGLAILADGMGGYNAGEVASGMATAVIGTELEQGLRESRQGISELLETVIGHANDAIYRAAESQPQYSGMGTTLVMALFRDDRVSVAHIGDSRMYRLRGTTFECVTRDHSLLQEQIDSGMITEEEARRSQNKNLVTRALGVDPVVEPEIHTYEAQTGDVYLFCSDGLNDMVDHEDIALTLQALSANLDLAAEQLVQMANDNGGRDNVSVILVKVLQPFPAARRGWLARLLAWLK